MKHQIHRTKKRITNRGEETAELGNVQQGKPRIFFHTYIAGYDDVLSATIAGLTLAVCIPGSHEPGNLEEFDEESFLESHCTDCRIGGHCNERISGRHLRTD